MAGAMTIEVTSIDLKIIETEAGAALSLDISVRLTIAELLNALMSVTEKQKKQEGAQGHASTDPPAQPAPTPPEDSAKDEPSPTNTGKDQHPETTRVTWDTDLAELQPTCHEQNIRRWTSSRNVCKLVDDKALKLVKINRLDKRPLIKKAPTPETSLQTAQTAEEALLAALKEIDHRRPSESHNRRNDYPPQDALPPSMPAPLAESKSKASETQANKAGASPPSMPPPLVAIKLEGSEIQANTAETSTHNMVLSLQGVPPPMPSGPPLAPSQQKDCKNQ